MPVLGALTINDKKREALYHKCMLTMANTFRKRTSHGMYYNKNL